MANNTITYLSHTIVNAAEGYIVLDPINNSVLGIAMDMEEVDNIILHH